MKPILAILISFALSIGVFAQTRNVVVGTNDVIVSPTNFWNANVTNARAGLSLGSAATNPASAFQPSSSVLTNLASSNGINLTNIQASNIVGSISSSNISGVSFSNAIQSFIADVVNATNTATNSRNLTIYSIAPAVGGITNIVQLPTSNTVAGDLANIIHTGPTSSLTAVRQVGIGTNLISYRNNNESVKFVYDGTNWAVLPNNSQTFPIYFSGTNASANAAASRTNLGILLEVFTNSSVSSFLDGIGLGWDALTNSNAATSLLGLTDIGQVVANTGTNILTFTNDVRFADGDLSVIGQVISGGGVSLSFEDGALSGLIVLDTNSSIGFQGASAATTRTNLGLGATWLTNTNVTNFRTAIGLGWSALTNSNAGTGLVSVDSNGSVVSPTNFWQVAPIASNLLTIVQTFSPNTNSTNAATNGRNVYVYSLSTDVSGVTNTITLPTNAATLAGDTITVTHQGLTNSRTAIRRLGETNNLITINNLDEAVKFIYENGAWAFYHNISFVEPIRFSGTNASVNAAASRTNLGLGQTDNVYFNSAQIPAGVTMGDIYVNGSGMFGFGGSISLEEAILSANNGGNDWNFGGSGIYNSGAIDFVNTTNAATTRTNLGLGATNIVRFGEGTETNVGVGVGYTNTGLASGGSIIQGRLGLVEGGNVVAVLGGSGSPFFGLYQPITFQGANASSNAATSRTNLSLGLPALTNTNAAGFQRAIFSTNAAPTNSANVNTVNFNTAVAWIEISVVTNSVTNSYRIPVFQ